MRYTITPYGPNTWEITTNNGQTGGIYTTNELPHGLATCQHCNRVTRPPKTPKHQYTGTVDRASQTCCTSCYDRIKHSIPLPGNNYTCTKCGKKVNTSYTTRTGVGPSSNGLCRDCARTKNRQHTQAHKNTDTPTYTKCPQCGTTLVRAPHTINENQKRLYRRGMDRKCYEKALEEETWIEHPPELAAWEAARRARAEKRLRVADALTLDYARRMTLRRKNV